MDRYEIYNKYLSAINQTDLSILTSISSNIGSINLMSFDVSAKWESSVKDRVDDKAKDLKLKINAITSQTTNLNTIVSTCQELKAKIDAYNKVYSVTKETSYPSKLGNNATEDEKKAYNNQLAEYNRYQANIRTINNMVSEIDALVVKLQNINFDNKDTSTSVGSASTQPILGEGVANSQSNEINLSEADKKELNLKNEQIDLIKFTIETSMWMSSETKEMARTMSDEELLKYYEDHNYNVKELSDAQNETFESNLFYLSELVTQRQEILDRNLKQQVVIPESSNATVDTMPTSEPEKTIELTHTPTPAPSPTVEPQSNVQPLGAVPTLMPKTPTATAKPTIQTLKMDEAVVNNLGLKRDKNGNIIKVGNAYAASYGGMDYLLNIPLDANGNIITNSPVIMEFHGSGEAGKNMNITRMPQDRMGLREIASNPNAQAIYIMPQVKNPNYYASEFSQIDAVKNNVINTLGADSNNIVAYGHSAGATGGMKYVSNYPDGVKMYISIDGRPTSEFVGQLRDENIPLLLVNSNAGKNVSYNEHTNKLMKNYPEYQNLTYDIKDQNFKTDVGTAIEEMVGTNEVRAIYLKGSTHSTVRDATLNREVYSKIYQVFDIKNN